jgi:hypothetical protein
MEIPLFRFAGTGLIRDGIGIWSNNSRRSKCGCLVDGAGEVPVNRPCI